MIGVLPNNVLPLSPRNRRKKLGQVKKLQTSTGNIILMGTNGSASAQQIKRTYN